MVVALGFPVRVVLLLELLQGIIECISSCKPREPQQLFLEDPVEPLCAPVAFRFPDKRWARGNTKERKFLLEVPADVLASVVMPETKTTSTPFGKAYIHTPDCLPARLKCFEPGAPSCSMDAQALLGVVLDQDEDCCRSLRREYARGIRCPYDVRTVRDDASVVRPGAMRGAPFLCRKQSCLTHQTQYPDARRSYALALRWPYSFRPEMGEIKLFPSEPLLINRSGNLVGLSCCSR